MSLGWLALLEWLYGPGRPKNLLDPVIYLINNQFARFAELGEESRISAMNDMWNFQRKHGEPIDTVLARSETVRQRAALEGNLQ